MHAGYDEARTNPSDASSCSGLPMCEEASTSCRRCCLHHDLRPSSKTPLGKGCPAVRGVRLKQHSATKCQATCYIAASTAAPLSLVSITTRTTTTAMAIQIELQHQKQYHHQHHHHRKRSSSSSSSGASASTRASTHTRTGTSSSVQSFFCYQIPLSQTT